VAKLQSARANLYIRLIARQRASQNKWQWIKMAQKRQLKMHPVSDYKEQGNKTQKSLGTNNKHVSTGPNQVTSQFRSSGTDTWSLELRVQIPNGTLTLACTRYSRVSFPHNLFPVPHPNLFRHALIPMQMKHMELSPRIKAGLRGGPAGQLTSANL
jgi:hypothetical protein